MAAKSIHQDLAFWGAVGLVAVASLALFKFLAAILPIPALKTLAAAI